MAKTEKGHGNAVYETESFRLVRSDSLKQKKLHCNKLLSIVVFYSIFLHPQ